jgi:hypothetical protein
VESFAEFFDSNALRIAGNLGSRRSTSSTYMNDSIGDNHE